MAQDPTAQFVENTVYDASGNHYQTGSVVSDDFTMNGDANPRVFIAGLISPDFLAPGYDEVPLNNLAKFFLETIPPSEGSKEPVKVRFLGFVSGTGDEGPRRRHAHQDPAARGVRESISSCPPAPESAPH